MTKKAKILPLLLALLAPTLLACGGNENPHETTPPTDTVPPSVTETKPADTAPGETEPADPSLLSDEDYFSDERFLPVLRFSAASDVHIGDGGSSKEEARLKKLFEFTYSLAENSKTPYKGYDAAAFAGDISDNGTITSMKKAKGIMDRAVKEGTQLICMLGNHEFYTAPEGTVKRFREAYGTEERGHLVINGFHFLYLSPDASNGWDFTASAASWLNKELKKAAQDDPTRPIFVFEHEHVKDTVYGSVDWGVSQLYPVLKNYPQVVSFSGHSHFPLNDPRSIWQGEFTALNTGTLSYTEMGLAGVSESSVFPTDGKGHYTSSKANGSDAAWYYVVEVDQRGAIRVVGYDLDTGTELVRYFIRTPSDPSTYRYNTKERIKNSTAPVFPEGAKAEIKDVGKRAFTVTFPAASSDDNVQHYRVEILQNGKVIRKQYLLSCTFYQNPPKEFSAEFSGLPINSSYQVRVIAVNSFSKQSEPLTAEVTLLPSEQTPVGAIPEADVLKVVFGSGNTAVNEVTGKKLTALGSVGTEKNGETYEGVFSGKGGFSFEEISDYYETLSQSVSFEICARCDSLTSPDRTWFNLFSNQQAGGFGFEGDSSGRVFASAYIGGTYRTPGAFVEKGEYFHAVVTYDGKTLCYYLNGALADSVKIAGKLEWPSVDTARHFVVGGDSFTGNTFEAAFTGRIAAANIYSEVLSEAQVASLYASYAK